MSTSDICKICKDGASKSNNDDVCELEEKLQKMSTADNNVSICANCGKEGSDVYNICNKCKQVKYCNAACKKKHRNKHKKECEEHVRLATEQAAKLHDEKLFKQPPPKEDCPICFLRTPTLMGWQYQSCCGKVICCGCIHAPLYDDQGNEVDNKKCPFCRTPWPTKESMIRRLQKRVELDDAVAIHNLGCDYSEGNGFTQDYTKALELLHRAGELGHADAYSSIGSAYYNGQGVEVDKKKANHYYEIAAMGGDSQARYNLGCMEANAGNMDRALKHYMIAIGAGFAETLDMIKQMYSKGFASKDDYMKALRAFQAYLGEIKSDQRDQAAALHGNYRYY